MLNEILRKNKNELNNIINALEDCFFNELDEYNFEDNVVYPFYKKYKNSFKNESGATKGVLIFEKFNFVIKIPFMFCDGDKLCGAFEGDERWNYCSQEKNRYEEAYKNGLGEIFLQTDLLTKINNYPIYIQPYATILGDLNNEQYSNNHQSSKNEDKEKVLKLDEKEGYDYLNSGWEADLFVQYGIKEYKKFKEYIRDYDIIDLREANIGYIGKAPVIVDYAGFDL